MSSEIKFRQQIRNRKKKKKFKRNFLLIIFSVIFVLFAAYSIRFILLHQDKNNTEAEFIFNGYVYPEPPAKNDDVLVDAQNKDGIKTAYLTFDDGPNNSITPQILDTLRRYNIKATFFVVGSLVEANPHVARRIYDEGHFIANHLYSHNYTELYASSEAFMNELEKTEKIIESIVCKDNYTKIMRFPGGSHNSGKYAQIKQEIKPLIPTKDYRYCDWNALTGDAETSSPTESYIMKRLKATTKGKEDIVVLMHDALSKKVTANTLSEVIEYLVRQGYIFDTLDNI